MTLRDTMPGTTALSPATCLPRDVFHRYVLLEAFRLLRWRHLAHLHVNDAARKTFKDLPRTFLEMLRSTTAHVARKPCQSMAFA